MPDGNDALSKAKATLAHAQATFPAGNDGGHTAGQQFAQQHQADHMGGTKQQLMPDAGEKQGVNERMKAMKDLQGSNTSFMSR